MFTSFLNNFQASLHGSINLTENSVLWLKNKPAKCALLLEGQLFVADHQLSLIIFKKDAQRQ